MLTQHKGLAQDLKASSDLVRRTLENSRDFEVSADGKLFRFRRVGVAMAAAAAAAAASAAASAAAKASASNDQDNEQDNNSSGDDEDGDTAPNVATKSSNKGHDSSSGNAASLLSAPLSSGGTAGGGGAGVVGSGGSGGSGGGGGGGGPQRRIQKSTCTVWVGNLDNRATEELLYELFLQAGPLDDVVMPTDNRSGQTKGFAFVEYSSEVS